MKEKLLFTVNQVIRNNFCTRAYNAWFAKRLKIQIEVNGPNEDSFAIRLVELFEKEFDFSID